MFAEMLSIGGGGGAIELFTNPQMSADSQDGYVASVGNATMQDANSAPYKVFNKATNDWCTLSNMSAGSTYYQLQTPVDVFPVSMVFTQNADGTYMRTGKVMASKTGTEGSFVEIVSTFSWKTSANGVSTSVIIDGNADYYKYFRYYPLSWASYCSMCEWEIYGVTR